MKKINLPAFATTATLIMLCSNLLAVSDEIETTPVVVPAVVPAVETIAEPQATDRASASSPVTETADVESTETEKPAATEAVITTPSSDIEYTCQHDSSERIIRVFNDTPMGLACEVTYEKLSGTQTLWSANYDKEYCARKAAEFAAKQVGWGWHCVDKDGAAVSAPVETPVVEPSVTEAPAEIEENKTETPEVEILEAESTEVKTPEAEAAVEELK